MKVISTDVNSYITVSAGVNKSKSEYHSSSESTVKNKLESKGDINISSGAGSVTASQSKGKRNSEGTVNVNSKEVGGTHKVEAGEKVIYEGANVEAGRVEIKGEEVIIASSKDTEKSSSKNSNSSIKVTPGAPSFSGEINVGHREGNGEKEWVSDQTSIITKEGGIIESKDFTNSGAIIGSESEENKLIVKAENIAVEHLNDKDTNKVSGGEINIKGTGVPNLSIVTGGQDKRQDTNATAVNTEFEIAGKSKTAEELGFNTDLDKAQVIIKDEDKVLDAELHTDLLNKSERDKIAQAGEKIGDLAEAIANSNGGGIFNTYKENRFGNLLNDYIKKSGVSGLFLDNKISLEDKRMALTDLVEGFLNKRGYKGPMPEIHIGEKSFAVDSSKGYGAEPGKNGKEIIFISKVSLNSPNVLQELGHELGHLVKYDKDEKTAENVGSKIDTIKPGEEKDYKKYLASIKDKYKDLPSLEESKVLENRIPDEYKEKFAVPVPLPVLVGGVVLIGGYYYIQNSEENKENSTTGYNINVGASFGGRVGAGISRYVTRDYKNDKVTVFHTLDGALQITNPDLDTSLGFSFFPFVNDPTILEGRAHSIGVSFKIPYLEVVGGGFDVIYNTNNEWLGVKFSIGKSFYPFGVRASIADGATIIKKEELTFYEYNKKYHPRGGKNGY